MARRQSNREGIIHDGETPQESGVEVRLQSREEEILRQLGVIHLENKFTRPRNNYESDAMILRQAGVKLLNADDWEATTLRKSKKQVDNEDDRNDCVSEERWSNKRLSAKEAEILRSAGVALLDDTQISRDDDSFCHKLDCATSSTVAVTVGESTVNSTYAEKELLRRLKKGWSSTGEKCSDCGLPIIRKSRGNNLLECVICGVVGGEDHFNPDTDASLDGPTVGAVDELEIPGILHVGTFASTITPGAEGHDYESHYTEQPLDQDSKYKEELGRRLFDGWVLSSSRCTQCNKPLVSEFDGAPCVCLLCG